MLTEYKRENKENCTQLQLFPDIRVHDVFQASMSAETEKPNILNNERLSSALP